MNLKNFFTSQKNYLKRHPSSDSAQLAAPATLNALTFLYETILTVPHNLGYIPMVRVYYEPFTNGAVWPATGSRVSEAGPGLTIGDIMCFWEITTTDLRISLEQSSLSAPQTGTRTVYWVIYWDS